MSDNKFRTSVRTFVQDTGKMTFVERDEICSNFTLHPEEISVFISKGLDHPDKSLKTKEEIEKDKDHELIQLG